MTFCLYLFRQRHSDSPIGDFARDVIADIRDWRRRGFQYTPVGISTLPVPRSSARQAWRQYLDDRGASDSARSAFEAAHAKWRRLQEPTPHLRE